MLDQTSRRRSTIRVLLVDDHPIVRGGVRRALSSRRDILVVGEAASGRQALSAVEELTPEIILLDVNMGTMSGIEVARKLRKKAPGVKILVFTVHNEKEYVLEFARLGVRGYLSKEATREELVDAIHAVHAGKYHFAESASEVIVSQYLSESRQGKVLSASNLTERENEVLVLIAEGNTNKEIASRLKLSTRTVETHRQRIMRKLDVHTAIGLTKFAIQKGMIRVTPQR